MAVLLLVVLHDAALDAFLDDVEREVRDAVRRRGGRAHGDLKGREGVASVAVADFGEELPCVGGERDGDVAIAAFPVRQRPVQQHARLVGREGLQLEDERTARERRVDEHRRIVRGGADEDDRAVLDVREQDILLGLVEAVDLVDEEDRAGSAEFGARAVADLADLRDVRDDARTAHEVPARRLRDDLGERRLAAAGWTEQDDVRETVRLDDAPEQLAVAEDVALAHHLVKRARTHPRRQGFCRMDVHGEEYSTIIRTTA